MFSIIKLNWRKQLEYGRLFIAVRDNIFSAQYEEAMTVVDRMYAIYKEHKPSSKVKIQLNLVFGMVSWNLKRYSDVYNACSIALDQIDNQLSVASSRSKINDLKYLRAYCKALVGFADAKGGVRNGYIFSIIDNMTSPDYDLRKVSKFLQRTFPVGDTSWWGPAPTPSRPRAPG
jgi:hypothetical protein